MFTNLEKDHAYFSKLKKNLLCKKIRNFGK